MPEQIWGQILLTVATGIISIVTTLVGLFVWRSRARLKRRLDQERADHAAALEKERAEREIAIEKERAEREIAIEQLRAQYELEKKQFEAAAQERILKAEADIRAIASQQTAMGNQQLVLTQLLELLRDAGKRTDEKDSRVQAVLGQLLDSSRESTDTLKLYNQHFVKLGLDVGSVKTDLGESIRVLSIVEQVVSALPTQFDQRANPIVDSVKMLMKRIDDAIGSLGEAKQKRITELVAAIRDVNAEAIQEMISLLTDQTPSLTPNPIEGTS